MTLSDALWDTILILLGYRQISPNLYLGEASFTVLKVGGGGL